ncbi:hypothetical protein M1M07_07555 [Rhodococcus sp. HM1]|uniref:hypothetical protein n=1 Tax=Rhodococcus sp. HM1 TaxID=2937759 RepID=UPI00200B9CD7|nr:hypothetical protein [Rhodococcus sp. HM1]MCK8670972.1 hypothetical protein [Rhodococcus sp. HM1]
MSNLREDDDREWRRMQREEARAARRGTTLADAPETPITEWPTAVPEPRFPVPEHTAPKPGPKPAPVPSRGGPTSAPRSAPPFRIVDTLPAADNRSGRPIPQRRRELIKVAKENPRRWIEYPPAGDDAYKSISSFLSAIRSGKVGFGPKGTFEAAARNKIAYVRYVGTDGGDQQ